ncbi:MAG: AAA family ATPase [Deltaproteobacteria bacterium]|jgi:predicted ATPase|nr:AAA family ATPase [Deltaproteobacteria bacterium]
MMPEFDDFFLEPVENKSLNDKIIRLRWSQKGSSYLFQPWQMSDGTLRFLALALVFLQPIPPSIIVIDGPELGLNPESLNTLVGLIHEAAFKTQVILATQSPDLLRSMEPENVIIVDMYNEESKFKRLNRKNLSCWLKDYTLADLWWKKII